MKQKTWTKLLSFLLTLAMVIGLMPGMTLTVYADTIVRGVSYLYYESEEAAIAGTSSSGTQDCIKVEANTTSWGDEEEEKWYVVNSDVTIDDRITVTGTVT